MEEGGSDAADRVYFLGREHSYGVLREKEITKTSEDKKIRKVKDDEKKNGQRTHRQVSVLDVVLDGGHGGAARVAKVVEGIHKAPPTLTQTHKVNNKMMRKWAIKGGKVQKEMKRRKGKWESLLLSMSEDPEIT